MFKDLQACCVRVSGTIRDGLRAIEGGNMGIAFVQGEEDKLVGTLTDGDVRRALLLGKSLDAPLAPHVQRSFTSVGPGTSRAEVLDLMQARVLNQIPIVDAEGKVKGVHLLHEVVGSEERSNWAVVMAGGQGTRLGPISEHLPKPMIRVAGRPILERILLHLVSFGFRRIFLSVHYLSHIIEDYFGDGGRFGCQIEYLREDKPMGTGGALSLLPEKPDLPILLMNGDLVTQVRLDRMLQCHEENHFAATIAVRRYAHRVPYGCLCISERGTVVGIDEKPLLERRISAGIYVLSPSAVGRIPKEHYPITSLFEDLIKQKQPLGAFEVDEDWIDVGQREQLALAQGCV